jgi:site-specific DNA recombinase
LTKCIREDAVESAILRTLEKLRFSEAEMAYFRAELPTLDKQLASTQEEMRRSLTLQQHHIRERLNRLTDAYLDRMLDQETYSERKKSLMLEQVGLEEKLASAADGGKQAKRLEEVLELANSAASCYKSALPEQKRELLKTVTSNREVEVKIVIIELRSPFRELAERATVTSGSQERDVIRDPKSSWICKNDNTKAQIAQVWRPLLSNIFNQCRSFSPLLD